MLFGEGARRSFASLFATHPQLTDRIKALNPNFDPAEIAELQQRYEQYAERVGQQTQQYQRLPRPPLVGGGPGLRRPD